MALKGLPIAVALAVLAFAAAGEAQPVSVELSETAGYSTEDIGADAIQVHAFGELFANLRFNVEASWGARSAQGSDVFGAAYPYDNRLDVIEAYGERIFQPDGGLVAVRAGRYRTPFGISNASDYAYSGFLRAPLIRYGSNYALSNYSLEEGGDVVFGIPRLSLETSVGVPSDVGASYTRRFGVDTVLRGQAVYGPFILGISRMWTEPDRPALFAHGRAVFNGVDARWMRSGVRLQGEWLTGQPFDGATTTGGYVDLIVHEVGMGPVTAVARAEHVAYQSAGPFALRGARYTAGGRVRLFDQLSADIEVVHQTRQILQRRPTALDIGFTYALRRG